MQTAVEFLQDPETKAKLNKLILEAMGDGVRLGVQSCCETMREMVTLAPDSADLLNGLAEGIESAIPEMVAKITAHAGE